MTLCVLLPQGDPPRCEVHKHGGGGYQPKLTRTALVQSREAGKDQGSIHRSVFSGRQEAKPGARVRVGDECGQEPGAAERDALRASGVVVLGAVAFGYLSFRVGFKPYLDQAQEAIDSARDPDPDAATTAARDASDDPGAGCPGGDLGPSKDPAVVLRD
uniref:Uncharacterized protein n=1 Tax=Zea mays TaxID=4577 RepID=A0A804N2D1_MAIZE